ncbi:hypothetical protein Pla22_27040 [Rubripirellula amarantea]|uniref:Uncharacterized protein n=1 Tax=Rubripirellula amarantea TaxID=2527999 RepID=A0A5C5WWX9_9BACT|nr:hypothetical protein Pla22_27040 [Rubripirellula amarantea]
MTVLDLTVLDLTVLELDPGPSFSGAILGAQKNGAGWFAVRLPNCPRIDLATLPRVR